MVNINSFVDEIVTDLATEFSNDETFDINVLTVKVKIVAKELIELRNYSATAMTDEEIEDDIERFYSQVMNVARYDYNQIGAEGESSHNENGINRSFVDRKSLWNGVIPFAGV